jgi:hypothetical protein
MMMHRVSRVVLLVLLPLSTVYAQTGNLTVNSTPPGTTVRLEGEYELSGVTPVTFNQSLFGTYKLTAMRGGYENYSTILTLTGNEPLQVDVRLIPKTRFKAAFRSLLVPGWGQMYTGQKTRGSVYTVGAVLSLIGLALAENDFRDKKDTYNDVLHEFNEARRVEDKKLIRPRLEDAQQDAYDSESTRRFALGAVAFVWVLNVVDAAVFFPDARYTIGGPASISLNTGEEFEKVQLNLAVEF